MNIIGMSAFKEWFDNLGTDKDKGSKPQLIVEPSPKSFFPAKSYIFGDKTIEVPEGWIVYDLGQNPLFNLWHCTLVNMEDTRKAPIQVEEYDTMDGALEAAVRLIT